MSIINYIYDALIVLALASLPSVAWFFRVRKMMLKRQISIIRIIEGAVGPRDKRYWIHGYLVGFTGKYWVMRGPIDKVWVTYTTPPYHAFFYLPIIILLGRRERLEVVVESSRPFKARGYAYIYNPRLRSLRASVESEVRKERGRDRLRGVIRVDGAIYSTVYSSEEALDAAHGVLRDLSAHGIVYRVSLSSSRRMLVATVTPKSIEDYEAVVRRVMEKVEALTRDGGI